MSGDPTEVWILDDRDLRRAGLVALISQWVAGAGTTVRQLGAFDDLPAALVRPDGRSGLVIFNLGADSLDDPRIGARVAQLLSAIGGWPLLLLSDAEGRREVETAIALGARALLPSSMPADVAAAAIRFVLAGGSYFPHLSPESGGEETAARRRPPVVRIVEGNGEGRYAMTVQRPGLPAGNGDGGGDGDGGDGRTGGPGAEGPSLTTRQREVLWALQGGMTNKNIARELKLSEATVKVHVRQLMKKFGAMNRTQLALTAPRLPG